MATAADKWPAYAKLLAVAPAGHLPTAPTPLPGTRFGCSEWSRAIPHGRKASRSVRQLQSDVGLSTKRCWSSSNPVARAEALRAALADENVGIRNNALWAVLQRRNVLPVAVVLEAGGRIGPGEVPNLEIVGLRWDPEHRSFAGRFVSHAFASQATGEVLEGHLQIKYDRVKMPIRFGQPADIPLTNKDFAIRPCTVVLTVEMVSTLVTLHQRYGAGF